MKIAFIGLGEMGQRLCRRLLLAGHDVAVYNRDQAKAKELIALGARQTSSVSEACADRNLAIAMLADDVASQAVWSDPQLTELARAPSPLTVVEMSTLGLEWTAELERRLRARGLRFVAAPVIGSLLPAESGKLIVLAAGDRREEATLTPVLRTFGESIHWLGSVTAAATLKLAANYFFSAQVKSLADALAVLSAQSAEEAGLAIEVFKGLPIVSPPLAGVIGQIQAQNFAPQFPVRLVHKDLRYFAQLPGAQRSREDVHAAFARALSAGLGDQNISAVWKLGE